MGAQAYDFANLLFSGPCNARCSFCIGRQIDPRLNVNNLDRFPPANLEAFLEQMHTHQVEKLVFSGTNTDPQLYRHEARLLAYLRQRLPEGTCFALHTNGRLALRKLALVNQYDQVCISFPSFNPPTYRAVMGVAHPPDLAQIVARAQVPVKVSCVVVEANRREMGEFLGRCREVGVPRVVLRKLFGEERTWAELLDPASLGLLVRQGIYRNNPVYDYQGMQVTLWDFGRCASTSINLFSSGAISSQYLLAGKTLPLPALAAPGAA
ncbi:MAG: radical SAM protein [Chloroflexota bacterium]